MEQTRKISEIVSKCQAKELASTEFDRSIPFGIDFEFTITLACFAQETVTGEGTSRTPARIDLGKKFEINTNAIFVTNA